MANATRKLLIVASIPVLLVAALALVLLLTPLDSFRAPVERAVSKGIGRAVHIAGPLHASLYPEIGFSAGDVSIANVTGGQAREFAHVDTMAVGVRLLPLLSHQVEITRLVLEHPVMHLEVDGQGTGNWNFNFAKSSSSSSSSARLSISGVKITDGEISYFDRRTGRQKQLRQANASLSLEAFDQPAIFNIDAVYQDEKLTASGRVDSPDSYVRKQPTQVVLDLQSRLLNLHFDGSVIGADQSNGSVNLSGPSLRELLQGVVAFSSKPGRLGVFSLVGKVSSKDRVYALNNANFALDGMKATATLAADVKGKVPAMKGDVTLDHLDAASYMMDTDKDASAQRGWSNKPLSLSGLKLANAELAIKIGKLSVGALIATQNQMRLTLRDGVMTADILGASLYGGSALGRVVADAGQAVPRFALKLDVKSVAMKAFLQSAMKVSRLEGTGTLAMDVAGSGQSQQAIVDNLHGTGSALVRNGAIRGVDLAAVARTIQNALSGSLAAATSEKATTDFAEAGGTFAIANGVMHNQDFHLLNPFVRITGAGDIDLGRRTLNFRVDPKLVGTREGQGGARDAGGLGVPFQISGPWTKPSYKPDLMAAGRALVGQFKNGNALGGLLGNVMGNKNGGTQQRQPGFDLKGLFGR